MPVKNIGGLKQHGAIKPMGKGSHGGEYQADKLELSGRSVKPGKASTHKQAMIDGPYGGRKPA